LTLSRGHVKNLQNWHWITVVAAELDENRLMADASDEGRQVRFDLRLWYLSTLLGGGLVYFSNR
jgi:hypothetical protein